MAKMELRKPINDLITEKTNIDKKLTQINDEYTRYQEELQKLRYEQHSNREAKETLSNSNQNKPARRVFDQNIASAQQRINEVIKDIDRLEKDRVVWASKGKAIEKSIKELQNA